MANDWEREGGKHEVLADAERDREMSRARWQGCPTIVPTPMRTALPGSPIPEPSLPHFQRTFLYLLLYYG